MPTLSDHIQQIHGREMVQRFFDSFRGRITEARGQEEWGQEGRTSVCLLKVVSIISMGSIW